MLNERFSSEVKETVCVFFHDKLLTFPLIVCRISLHGERYGGLQVRSRDHPAQLCILEINISKLCKSIFKMIYVTQALYFTCSAIVE
jgi:hypothetical protein